jgi:uncharacterized protein YdhG (YjbR/CyaY superfamily)
MTMKKTAPKTVDGYLASVPAEMRAALKTLRGKIRKIVPDAAEGISYGMPTFKLNGRAVAHFAAFKSHCSFFPGSAIVEKFQDKLKGFKTSKGTIQFTPEHPIPDALLAKIIRARVAEAAREKRN